MSDFSQVLESGTDTLHVKPHLGSDDSVATQADAARRSPGADEVVLTNVMQKAMDAPSYDQAKVENIKKAIKDGQYPLDPRRIAESFNALEKLIRG